jgi:type IV pilus assembly protein PilP
MRVTYLIALSALLLAGCGEEEFQDLQEFVKNSGANMRGKIEPPPEVKPYEPFKYDNSADLPDPFKPRKPEARTASRAGLNQPDLERHKEELEDFALESLKMVAFLRINNVNFAVIRSPDTKLHHVKVGNYMGQNFGQIIEITETEVKLKEVVQDSAGDWTERISSLQLME